MDQLLLALFHRLDFLIDRVYLVDIILVLVQIVPEKDFLGPAIQLLALLRKFRFLVNMFLLDLLPLFSVSIIRQFQFVVYAGGPVVQFVNQVPGSPLFGEDFF